MYVNAREVSSSSPASTAKRFTTRCAIRHRNLLMERFTVYDIVEFSAREGYL
jgi:hypothetical protein